MNGKAKVLLGIALVGTTTALMAGHCHHDDGLHLAAGIVNLVSTALAPHTVVVAQTPAAVTTTTAVVTAPAAVATPVVVAPAPCYHQAPPPEPHHCGPCRPCEPCRPCGPCHRK